MDWRYRLRVFPALIYTALIILVCMSGPYHEAPANTRPLFGHSKIMLSSGRFPVETPELTAVIDSGDIPLLGYFTNLTYADFSGSPCYEEIYEWAQDNPQVTVKYTVDFPDGSVQSSDVTSLDLSHLNSGSIEQTARVLRYLPSLTNIRLGAVGGDGLSIDELLLLKSSAPQASFDFSASVGGVYVDSSTERLDLSSLRHEDVAEAVTVLSCLSNVTYIDLGTQGSNSTVTWEDISAIRSARPEAELSYSFTLYGQKLDLAVQKLDFRQVSIEDEGKALMEALPCLSRCTYLDMDSTGVSNEAMEKIRDSFPDIEVVWRIWFGTNYSVRTDTERILASKPTVGGMIYDSGVLKYCTKAKYVDVGHNDEMYSVDFAASMPDLEVLIIAMTAVKDISPLANCPKLEYLELNSTNIGDLSPLRNSTALRHVNICCCPKITDISPLYGIHEMERLWIGCETPVPADQVSSMQSAAPLCTINTTTEDPHGAAWRYSRYDPEEPKYYWVPRYEKLREQLGYNYQEYSFYWLDPLCDKEAPAEFRGKYGKEVYG